MKIEYIDKLIEPIDEFISRETELLPSSTDIGFSPVKLDANNFFEMSMFSSGKGMVAIDGGNANIIKASNISVDFFRVVAVFYKDNKRVNAIKKEFFCIITANADEKIYDIQYIGDGILDLTKVNSRINTLDEENYELDIESIPGIIRRFAELELAKRIIEDGFDLVIDGSIKVKTEEELSRIKELIDFGDRKKAVVGFLSKTCRLLAGKTGSLNAALNELGPKSSWYYYPVFKIQNKNYLGEMYFVKLDSKSKYCFRLEIGNKTDPSDYILNLSKNSSDPIFYGYPYCLIDADKFARVTNKEKDYLKALAVTKIKNKKKFQYLISNLDAHDILDNIN